MKVSLALLILLSCLKVFASSNENLYFQCLDSLDRADHFYFDADHFSTSSKTDLDVIKETSAFKNSSVKSIILNSVGAPGDTREKSTPKPVGLLTYRVENDKRYLFVLTRDGFRKIAVSDADSKKNLVVGVNRLEEGDTHHTFPNSRAIKIDGDKIKPIPLKEVRKADKDQWELLIYPEKFKDDDSNKFVAIEYGKAPLREGDKNSAQVVFKEELESVIRASATAHGKQMDYLKNATAKEIEKIKFRFKGRDVKAYAEELTQGYAKSLENCDKLNIGVSGNAQDAISKIKQAFSGKFDADGRDKKQEGSTDSTR